jgi:hypothetical protein
MVQTVSFFSNTQPPAEIQKILGNQQLTNAPNGDIQGKIVSRPNSDKPAKVKSKAKYKISFNYKVTGPFTMDIILQKIQSGEVTREWYICPPGHIEKSPWPKIDAINDSEINAALTRVETINRKNTRDVTLEQKPKARKPDYAKPSSLSENSRQEKQTGQDAYILSCNGLSTRHILGRG